MELTEPFIFDPDAPSAFVAMMDKAVPEHVRAEFASYIKQYSDLTTWHIFSDYCIGNSDYPNDVLVFTTFPEHHHEMVLACIKDSLPADLKKRSDIDDKAIEFLKHRSLFTFAFALDKKPRFLPTVEIARKVIDEILESLMNGPNSKTPTNLGLVAKMRHLKEQAKAKNFNLSLFNRVYMAVVFASYITLLFARNTKLEIVYWIGDRDTLHDSWNGLCYTVFHGMSYTYMNDEGFPLVRVRFPSPEADFEATFDPYTRIPDHFAGPLAHLDLSSQIIHAKSPKYERILKKVLAGNPRFSFASISFRTEKPWLTMVEIRQGPPPRVS
ncbi:MAG: hypothetical protein U0105_17560 [Candidatus Obscuribacterales bacterium]